MCHWSVVGKVRVDLVAPMKPTFTPLLSSSFYRCFSSKAEVLSISQHSYHYFILIDLRFHSWSTYNGRFPIILL